MKNPEILVIDDEDQIQKLLKITLQANEFNVTGALTAKDGLKQTKLLNPDLVLLDLGLPDESGHEVLTQLRQWFTRPIIILSVQSNEEDIVKALDNGANDYLVKPFRTGELLARLRSSIRSSLPAGFKHNTGGNVLEIDIANRLVKKNEGRVLTHHYLLREVWGPGYIDQSQYLRVFVNQLRKKIETEPNQPQYILTESGVGYRFIAK